MGSNGTCAAMIVAFGLWAAALIGVVFVLIHFVQKIW